jgi:hypothetical protein
MTASPTDAAANASFEDLEIPRSRIRRVLITSPKFGTPLQISLACMSNSPLRYFGLAAKRRQGASSMLDCKLGVFSSERSEQ